MEVFSPFLESLGYMPSPMRWSTCRCVMRMQGTWSNSVGAERMPEPASRMIASPPASTRYDEVAVPNSWKSSPLTDIDPRQPRTVHVKPSLAMLTPS